MKKNFTSMIVIAVMLVTMIPAAVFADDSGWQMLNGLKQGSVWSKDEQIYITNNTDKVLEVDFKIYADKEHTKLIGDEDNDGCTAVIKIDGGAGGEYYLPVTSRLDTVEDSSEEMPSKVTLVFHDVNDEITGEQQKEIESMEKEISRRLSSCDDREYEIMLADPGDLNIEGWTNESAVEFAYSPPAVVLHTGLEMAFKINRSFVGLNINYYYDRGLQQPVDQAMEAGNVYYADIFYSYSYNAGEFEVYGEVHAEKPCKFKVEFTNVEQNSPEIGKIKENIGKEYQEAVDIIYDDMAWLNILAFIGNDAMMPSIENAGSILKSRSPEMFKELVGDTNLDIMISFGGAGGGDFLTKYASEAQTVYYVDDVLYYNEPLEYDENGDIINSPISFMLNMSNVLYVSEESDDRAEAAEDRIEKYMDDDHYDVDIEEMSPENLAEYGKTEESVYLDVVNKDGNTVELDRAEAAYLTEYGIAFYDDENNTNAENFVGITPLAQENKIDFSKLEEGKDSLYIKASTETNEFEENVQAYKIYKLSLKGSDYLYVLGVKPGNELEKPLADWEDKDSGIITEGENGQVAADFYTKIRKTKDGEIKVITQKIKANKVNSYDINAYTNFKSEKITDLGNGKVKVKIPLDDFGKENLKAFYYDQRGNVVYLDFTIETEDGKEYVCFITNHFSTYGIATVNETAGGAGTANDGNNDIKGEMDKSADTGDRWNMLYFVMAVIMTVLSASVFTVSVRKRRAD